MSHFAAEKDLQKTAGGARNRKDELSPVLPRSVPKGVHGPPHGIFFLRQAAGGAAYVDFFRER